MCRGYVGTICPDAMSNSGRWHGAQVLVDACRQVRYTVHGQSELAGQYVQDLPAAAQLAALDGGTLHLGAPDGPQLARQELPYPLPADADQPA